jgi:putative alpha-1,2-mannosidase
MVAKNLSDTNVYVQSVEMNGRKIDNPFLPFSAVNGGGTLTFTMGAEPSGWGTEPHVPR